MSEMVLISLPNSLAEQFHALRNERNLTLAVLATETGMSVGYLSDLEHGRTRPSLWALEKLANYYDIAATDWILEPQAPITSKQQNLYARIGQHVKEERERMGMTQLELARKIKFTRTSITNLEAGRQRILVHTIVAIAETLGVNVDHLIRDEPSQEQGDIK